MGKPAISLSYSVKYKGVIGEGLGMKDLIIEARGDDLWESGKIVNLVMEKAEYVLTNYDSLVSRIKPAVEENKKLAMDQIEDIANKLKEKLHR
jgi:colanic acid/amylovoran biosynthesis protein